MTDGQHGDWRDEFDASISEMWNEALRKGASPALLEDAKREAARKSGRPIAEDLAQQAHEARHDLDDALERARDVIDSRWGEALDLFAAVHASSYDFFADYHARRANESDSQYDDAFWVLAGLMARAVRTAQEVYVLLRAGFPAGALTRARTLHELAVIAYAIGTNRNTDVAKRYVDHDDVETYRRMSAYQEDAPELGYPLFSEADVASAKRANDAARNRHGRGFSGKYGWAVPLFEDNVNPRLEDLEDKLGMSLMRSWKKWADHEVHATSHGSTLNLVEADDNRYRITGPVSTGFADPAQVALIALVQTLTAAVVYGSPAELRATDRTLLHSISQLQERALDAFAEIERDDQEQPGDTHGVQDRD